MKYIIIFVTVALMANSFVYSSKTGRRLPNYEASLASPNKKLTKRSGTEVMPLLVLHIGPRKTATTAIQKMLWESRTYLLKDSFVYFGREQSCMYDHAACPTSKQEEFQDKLRELRSSGTNVILSDENFSYMFKSKKKILMLKNKLNGFHVCVVVGYRRYFDWLLSEYDQQLKREHDTLNLNMMTLTDYYQNLGRSRLFAPLDVDFFNRWKRYFNDIYILNLHDKSTVTSALDNENTLLFTRFMCQAIPEAKNTCNALRNGALEVTSSIPNKANEKLSADAILLTLSILLQNSVHFNENDKEKFYRVADKVDQYLSLHFIESNYRYSKRGKPLSCLSKINLGQILKTSIENEKYLLPNFYKSENGASVLMSSFKEAVRKKKFCQLDVTALLNVENHSIFYKKEFLKYFYR